jgi:hypothetical protein
MPKSKPTVLARQFWGKHVTVEVRVDSGSEIRREIARVRRAFHSPALSEILLLMIKGTSSPSELARLTEKSKYAASVQLSTLKRIGLVKASRVIRADMRRKSYEVVWDKIAQIFRQDHALELEIYENQLVVAPLGEIEGNISRVGLAISGNGKLGLVREIIPHDAESAEWRQVGAQVNQLIWEFVEFFKGYVKERRFNTMHEYFLGAYDELSEHHSRLPENSELAGFFEFNDRSFKRIMPVEQIWRKYLPKKPEAYPILYTGKPMKEFVIKLFTEAGSADPSGRYILNADARAAIKPGAPLKIYPAYTYS